MTTTEQIVWAHRVDKDVPRPSSGPARRCSVCGPAAGVGRHRAVCDSRSTRSPAATHRSAPGSDRQRPLRLHGWRPTRSRRASARHSLAPSPRASVLRHTGRRHLHFHFPEQGLIMPGQFVPGADSHSRAWRPCRCRDRLHHARLRVVDGVHLLHARPTTPGGLRDACSPGSAARTSCWSCCAGGARNSRRACRWSSSMPTASCHGLSQHHREHDGGSRGLERHLRGRRHTSAWYRQKGVQSLPYPPLTPGADAVYVIDETWT